MKKNLLTLCLVLILFFPGLVNAQKEVLSSQTPKIEVEYFLPFPGILPDHPFYSLKILRDRIYDFLLSDPLEKAKFKLLMSDKRMYMAIMLIDKNSQELAVNTVEEASLYFEQGVLFYDQALQQGRDTNELKEKYQKATLKYEEIIVNLQQKSSKENKERLQQFLNRIKENRGKIVG